MRPMAHQKQGNHVDSNLRSITPVVTKVHVMLWSFVVLTWMRDTMEFVYHVTLWNDTQEITTCNPLGVGPHNVTQHRALVPWGLKISQWDAQKSAYGDSNSN